jgi:phospholipid transport system substrate-binding protein
MTKSKNKAVLILAAGVLAALLPLSSSAAEGSEAFEVRAAVEGTVNAVLDVLRKKDLDQPQLKARVLAIITPAFDLPLMGKLVLGRAHWPKLNEAQRKEFLDLFVKTIHDSYYEKISLFTDETVEFDAPAPSEKGKYEMMTRIVSKGQRYKLLYKLYRSGTAWKVYDVELEGISLVRTYSAQYDQVLQKGPVEDLLAKMREKALPVPEDIKKATKR